MWTKLFLEKAHILGLIYNNKLATLLTLAAETLHGVKLASG